MTFVSRIIQEEGKLVENGFGDIKILVEDQEILAVKSLFCGFNAILTQLVTDSQFNGVLELFEGCTVESFFALDRFYSCGKVEINEKNCVDILSICVYYDEKSLFNRCKKFIKKHITDEVISKILNRIELFHCELLNDVHQITNEYLQFHSLELLQKEIIINLNIEGLKFILQSQSLCIRNETELLKSLIYYYKFKEYESDLNDKNELQKIFEFISYQNIDFNSLDKSENELINDIPIVSILLQNFNLDHIVVPIPENINKILYPIILKYYINKEEKPLLNIEKEDINILIGKDLNESIEILLNTNDIKIIIIILLIIIDCELQYNKLNDTSSVIYKNIFSKLLSEYLNSNENIKYFISSIPKCLILFINDELSIETFVFICGRKLLYNVLNFHQYISDKKLQLIIMYLKKYKYKYNDIQKREIIETEDKEYFEILENIQIKSVFITFLATFEYPNYLCHYFVDEEVSIKPICDGINCNFNINPELPNGMIFNNLTGEISGKCHEVVKQKYTIICENITNKITYQIKIEIYEDIKIIKYLKSNKNKSLKDSGDRSIKSKEIEDEYYYLNITMDKYIYHIKYRISGINKESSFQIGATNENHFPKESYEDKTSCCFSLHSGLFYLYGANGNPIKSPTVKYTDNSVYECIFNMKTKQFILKYENGIEEILWEKIQGPLYPFISLSNENTIDLIGYWKE